MKIYIILTLSCILTFPVISSEKEIAPILPIKNGKYIFIHKFAEQPNIESIKLITTIKDNHIKIINNDNYDVFPKGTLEEGTLMWHSISKQWIIADSPKDIKELDVGGCTAGPSVVNLEKRIYWTC